jgi:hypothetical protein
MLLSFTKGKMSMNDKEKLDALPEEEIRKRCEERLIKMGAVEWAIFIYFFPYKSSLRACKQFLNFPDEKILKWLKNWKLKDQPTGKKSD